MSKQKPAEGSYQKFDDESIEKINQSMKNIPSITNIPPPNQISQLKRDANVIEDEEILYDLTEKQMKEEWAKISNQDKLNLKKWLENYHLWSSKYHDIHPEVIAFSNDNLIWRYYVPMRRCLIEAYNQGKIIFYDLQKKKKFARDNLNDRMIVAKTNKNETLFCCVCLSNIFIYELNNYNILSTINISYNSVSSFEFNESNDRLICFGSNFVTNVGICVWNLTHHKVENYCNNLFNFEKIIEVFYDKSQSRIFYLDSKFSLNVWYLNVDLFKPDCQKIHSYGTGIQQKYISKPDCQKIHSYGTEIQQKYINKTNELLYLLNIDNGHKSNIMIFNIKEERKEVFVKKLDINSEWSFVNYEPIDPIICFTVYETNYVTIFFDYEKEKEVNRLNFQLNTFSNYRRNYSMEFCPKDDDFFACYKNGKVYIVNETEYGEFQKNGIINPINLNVLEGDISSKNFLKLDSDCVEFSLNPHNTEICLFVYGDSLFFVDIIRMKTIRMILDIHPKGKINLELCSPLLSSEVFIDDSRVLIYNNDESDQNFSIMDVYTNKVLSKLNLAKMEVTGYCNYDDESLLFSVNTEICRWKYDKYNFKVYAKRDCEVLKRFERDICFFRYLKSLNYLLVNLKKKNSIVIYDINQRKIVYELKGHTQEIKYFNSLALKNYAVSICEEKRIILWDLKEFKEVSTILGGTHVNKKEAISSVSVSSDAKYIAIAQNQKVFVWELENGFLWLNFEMNNIIITLEMDIDIFSIYILDSLGTLTRWNLNERFTNFNKITDAKTFDDIISYCSFSKDSKYIIIESLNKLNLNSHQLEILTWPNKKLIKKITSPLNWYEYYRYSWTPRNEAILWISNSNLSFYFLKEDIEDWVINLDIEKYFQYEICISEIFENDLGIVFYITCASGVVKYVVNLKNRAIIEKTIIEIHSACVEINPLYNEEICIGGTDGELYIYDVIQKTKVKEFEGHDMRVSYISFSNNGKKVCSCGIDSVILVWNIGSELLDMKLIGHKFSINMVKFSKDDSRIISCGSDSTLRVWSLYTQSLEKLIEIYDDINVSNCEFSKDGKYIATGFNEGMIFKFDDFNYFIQQSKCIFLLKNSSDFEDLCNYLQPFILQHLSVNFIKPFGFSILHSLAYLELYEELITFINVLKFHKIKFAFFIDCTNRNIIDILIEANQLKVVSFLIEYLIEFPPNLNSICEKFNKSIQNILPLQLALMEKLLDSKIHRVKFNKEFYTNQKLSIFTKTVKNINPSNEELKTLFPTEIFSKDTAKVSFSLLDFKGALDPEINFCQSISEYPNTHPIFGSKSVKLIVNHKWDNYAKAKHTKRFLIFALFTMIATFNSYFCFIERISYPDNDIYLFASIFCDFVIFIFFFLPYLIYEVKDLILTGLSYFQEFWNFVDIFNLLLFFVLFCLEMLEMILFESNQTFINVLKVLHSTFIFILWLKLLSFSTILEGTAFIYTAVLRIIKDMRYFLFLLFTLNVMFAVSLFILQDLYPDQTEEYDSDNYQKKNRFQLFFIYYKLILGDYDNFFELKACMNDYFFKFLFIISTVFMFIILMNFIISLVSMVFSSVVEVKDLTYLYEKNKIIAEIDRNLTKSEIANIKNSKNIHSYLLICETSSSSNLFDKPKDTKKTLAVTSFTQKLRYDLVDKVNFSFGTKCSNCSKKLMEFVPQYYCFFCDLFFCPECGDKVDATKKGSASLLHPHNLVWINVTKTSGMKHIDKYKLGKIIWYEYNAKNFQHCCNGCGMDGENECRWICLSCRPGKFRGDGFIDFCNKCMMTLKKKEKNEDFNKIIDNLDGEDHDVESHVFYKVALAENYFNY